MISAHNKPLNTISVESDFTTENYSNLCKLAVRHYPIADYANIPWGGRFLLWRHDMDYSLNRGLALAAIESEVGLRSTFFLNPHCEFYNLAEASQHAIIKEILRLGHHIGLHFDVGFYGDISEIELNEAIVREADYLKSLFDFQLTAFSFHNPVASTLKYDLDTYGCLLNCYSKRFKNDVAYTSDSNGYWRYRRLHDVLCDAINPCLQVLTHPGWWQDKPMSPRQRIFRSTSGRAESIMLSYEEGLRHHGRLNHKGLSECLVVLKDSQPHRFELCEYLWSKAEFQTLFVELWRVHKAQINRLCNVQFRKEWAAPAYAVNEFFSTVGLYVSSSNLFYASFNESLVSASSVDGDEYFAWSCMLNQVIHSRSVIEPAELELGCVAICNCICCLAQWGNSESIGYGGLTEFESIISSNVVTPNGNQPEFFGDIHNITKGFFEKRWSTFKVKLYELESSQNAYLFRT